MQSYQAATNPVTKQYLSEIKTWVNDTVKYCPTFSHQAGTLLYLASMGADKDMIYKMGTALSQDIARGNTNEKSAGGEDGYIELKSFKMSNGVLFRDMTGHFGDLWILKDSHGNPYIRGNMKLAPHVFGRGEFDTAYRRMTDGDYLNDK